MGKCRIRPWLGENNSAALGTTKGRTSRNIACRWFRVGSRDEEGRQPPCGQGAASWQTTTTERTGDSYDVGVCPTGLIARLAFIPSLTGLGILSFPFPGTAVPGYRLFRPRSTSSGQALRDWLSPVGHRAILPPDVSRPRRASTHRLIWKDRVISCQGKDARTCRAGWADRRGHTLRVSRREKGLRSL
jgi:hypothetical protein